MFLGTAAFFLLALVLGGLGPHAPLLDGLIEAAAFPLLVAVLLLGRTDVIERRDCVLPILFVLLWLAIGLFQIVPLSTSIWNALPGRDVPVEVWDTLGQANRPRPLSLAPETTRLVVQSWLPPVAVFISTIMASGQRRVWLGRLVIAAAALSSLLGLAQLSFGDGTLFLDPGGISNRYPGLFANYNHQAVFLAAAVALLPPAISGGGRTRAPRSWPAAFWVLALFGVLATSSRAGLALFALASLVTASRTLGSRVRRSIGRDRRRAALIALVAFGSLVLAGWLTAGGYRGELMSSRFASAGSDVRYEFWNTSFAAARSVFPYGAGFGTFEPAYQLVEPLEGVQNYVVNHAHNDYLEITLEAGVGAIALVALFAAWFAVRVAGLVRGRGAADPLAWSGATIIMIVMLHSLVDYPLRTEAIGCAFAFACALLMSPPGGPPDRLRSRTRPPGVVA